MLEIVAILQGLPAKIKEVLQEKGAGQEITIIGWVHTFRNNQFINLNDGSIQLTAPYLDVNYGVASDLQLKKLLAFLFLINIIHSDSWRSN